jgi:hypothetical protein
MGRAAGRRCAHQGCRAWAMRGQEACRVHSRRAGISGHEEESPIEEPIALAPVPLPPELERLIAERGRGENLAAEIGALRVVLAQLLATAGGDAGRLSQDVPRVVNAIVRAVRVQYLLAGESAGDLTASLTRILAELGVGETK